jgi:mannosylglycerate hydrolase
VPLPTYPAYGWIDAGGAAVLLDQVTEYELLHGRELALTLLRSIGMISRNDNPYRQEPAGPERPTPAAQLDGPLSVAFAIYPHAGEWHQADVAAMAEQFANDFLVERGAARTGASRAPAAGLTVEGDGVVLTALLRRDEWLEVRIVAERPAAGSVLIGPGIATARDADLLGRPGAALSVQPDGWLRLSLEPFRITTVQLQRAQFNP